MKWFPPIAVASPSPELIQTESFGFAILTPVAIAAALP